MRHILVILALLTVAASCMADEFSRRVRTQLTPNGTIYFVGHKKLNKAEGGIKRFEYDLTYVEGRDSATLNLTILSANPSDVSVLTLSNGVKAVEAGSVSLLYHDIVSKEFEIRASSRILLSELSDLLTTSSPITFSITRSDGQQQQVQYTQSQWKKEHELYQKFFYLIGK